MSQPIVHPAARTLWRPDGSLQLELGTRAVVVDRTAAAAVRTLRGPQRADAAAPDSREREVLDRLLAAGYLWPAAAGAAGAAEDERLSPPQPRLIGELRALMVRHGTGAAELLEARRHASVVVHGTGRAGPLVAALLAAAGVGKVAVTEPRTARLHQSVPGGVDPADEGRALGAAATDAVLRAAPGTDVRGPAPGERPDLLVLACDEPVDPDQHAALHGRGQAHLLVRLGADHGAVGPLVVPGLTSCLHCADLHRRDRDPAWSALAVQLSCPPPTGAGSPVALAATIAGAAAAQALAFLDGDTDPAPAVIDGTLEQQLPDWRLRRRSWPVHPDCGCCAGSAQ